jgi:hypothetical protein
MSASVTAVFGVGDAKRARFGDATRAAAAERYGRRGDGAAARAEPVGVMSASSAETRASRERGDAADGGKKGPGDRRRVYDGCRSGLSTLADRPLDERPDGAAAENERMTRQESAEVRPSPQEKEKSYLPTAWGGNRNRGGALTD